MFVSANTRAGGFLGQPVRKGVEIVYRELFQGSIVDRSIGDLLEEYGGVRPSWDVNLLEFANERIVRSRGKPIVIDL